VPPNYFSGPNLAQIDRDAFSNALLRNEVKRAPQRAAAEDQAYRINEQEMQIRGQDQASVRKQNARQVASGYFSAMEAAQDLGTIGAIASSNDFRAALTELGLPADQFVVGPQDNLDALRAQISGWAHALGGGAIPRLENPNIPAAVRTAEYYNELPTEGPGLTRGVYSEANRAPTLREIGGVQTQVGPGGSTNPLGSLDTETEAQRQIAAARASGAATGGAQGAAAAGLPDALADINKMRRDIQGFVSHPGFSTVYGKSRVGAFIPGTEAAGAEGRRRTLDAQAFGVTIQKMRGLGALSNAEGQKVTEAFTHATNPRISEEEAKKAWDDVLYYLDLAEQRANQKALLPGEAQPASGGWTIVEVP
jgi:hypothetical protein